MTADITPKADKSKRIKIYDSGTTCHMSLYIEALTNFKFITPKPISAANNQTFEVIAKGTLCVKVHNGDAFTVLTLNDVLYAPNIAFTLVSLSRADKASLSTLIEDGELHFINCTDNNQVISQIPSLNGLWSICSIKAAVGHTTLTSGERTLSAISLMNLHHCLGHISPAAIAQLVNKGILDGVMISSWDVDFCEVCALVKIKRHPFPKLRSHLAQDIGNVIHSDVWGLASVQAIGGENYVVTFIDEKSHYSVVEGIKAKSNVFGEYLAFEAWLQVQQGKNIRHIQLDRGGEYLGNKFTDHLCQQCTTRQLTVHNSPQSNGIAEHCNSVLLEHVRTLPVDSGLPKFLWKEALRFAMWIRNWTTTHHLDGKIRYEVFYGTKPDIGDIHLWDSCVWVRDLTPGKLDSRGREGCFVEYYAKSKGCRIYWTDSGSIGVERDLIFEDWPTSSEFILLPELFGSKAPRTTTTPAPAAAPAAPILQPPEVIPDEPIPSDDVPSTPSTNEYETLSSQPPPLSPDQPDLPSKCIRKPSALVCDLLEGKANGGAIRGKSRLLKGVQPPTGMLAAEDRDISTAGPDHEAFIGLTDEAHALELAMVSSPTIDVTDDDPRTLAEVMERSDWADWQKAMEEELSLMAKYDVWDVVDQPMDTNIIGCRWVFQIKQDSSGKILKYPACLVTQGFTQLYGVDFNKTFAPVSHLSSI